MSWTTYDTWLLVIAALAAVNCALLGNFLVLRKLSMMGDAISHSVLPGLALALLIGGGLNPTTLFIGAAVIGIITAVLIQFVHRGGGVDEGASMGVVFTSLFAIGLILIRRVADQAHVDLDPDCVLFGQLADAALVAPGEIPSAAITMGLMLLVNAAFVGLFFKELRITAFDPALADTLGIRSSVMHYATMTLVAMTAVAAFESVGSILVIALLIAPPATALLLTRRLGVMVLLSIVSALTAAGLGYLFSTIIPAELGHGGFNIAGMTAVMAGGLFGAVLVVEPKHGILSRWVRRLRLAVRTAEEDVLATLWRREEREMPGFPAPATTRGPVGWLARRQLVRHERARWGAEGLLLTHAGRRTAEKLLRSHRLWERYMADRAGVRPDHTHRTAEELEHVTDDTLRDQLAADATSATDPHGKPIP